MSLGNLSTERNKDIGNRVLRIPNVRVINDASTEPRNILKDRGLRRPCRGALRNECGSVDRPRISKIIGSHRSRGKFRVAKVNRSGGPRGRRAAMDRPVPRIRSSDSPLPLLENVDIISERTSDRRECINL